MGLDCPCTGSGSLESSAWVALALCGMCYPVSRWSALASGVSPSLMKALLSSRVGDGRDYPRLERVTPEFMWLLANVEGVLHPCWYPLTSWIPNSDPTWAGCVWFAEAAAREPVSRYMPSISGLVAPSPRCGRRAFPPGGGGAVRGSSPGVGVRYRYVLVREKKALRTFGLLRVFRYLGVSWAGRRFSRHRGPYRGWRWSCRRFWYQRLAREERR